MQTDKQTDRLMDGQRQTDRGNGVVKPRTGSPSVQLTTFPGKKTVLDYLNNIVIPDDSLEQESKGKVGGRGGGGGAEVRRWRFCCMLQSDKEASTAHSVDVSR